MKENAGVILVVWPRTENYISHGNLLLHPSMQYISNINHSQTTIVKTNQCCQNGDHKKEKKPAENNPSGEKSRARNLGRNLGSTANLLTMWATLFRHYRPC